MQIQIKKQVLLYVGLGLIDFLGLWRRYALYCVILV